MGDVVEPNRVSIDGLIDWLRQQRVRQPQVPLADLLSNQRFPSKQLVDLACIDLIERRRLGHEVTVESYLQEFPNLQSESTRLDLIDAEICVAQELGIAIKPDTYFERFPDLAHSIQDLLNLETAVPITPPLPPLDESKRCSNDSTGRVASLAGTDQADAQAAPVPVPDWFQNAKTVACRPGSWLLQGRDARRGDLLAMKVIELPNHVTAERHAEMLDSCEAAANVRNPTWVRPDFATVHGRHLAVVRPWVFAVPLREIDKTNHSAITHLSSTAFAIQAAHDQGTSHGGIHDDNLLVDHFGKVHVVDAVCTLEGIRRWLRIGEDNTDAVGERIRLDTQCLIQLTLAHTVHLGDPRIAGELQRIEKRFRNEACARIGEWLLAELAPGTGNADTRSAETADSGVAGWGARLGNWLRRDSTPPS